MWVGFKAQAKFAPNFYWVYSLLYKIILYNVSIYFFFDILSGGVEFALPKFSCLDFYVVDTLFIVFLRYSVLENLFVVRVTAPCF